MYTQDGNVLRFFTPIATLAAGAITVLEMVDIGAASSNHGEMLCVRNCKVKRLGFIPVSEAASGTTTAPTVVFTKRPTPLSATGASAVGTVTVPSGTAVGVPVYKDIDPVAFEVGDSMHIAWTVGVGTPTGIGHWFAICEDDPEEMANVTGAVESA